MLEEPWPIKIALPPEINCTCYEKSAVSVHLNSRFLCNLRVFYVVQIFFFPSILSSNSRPVLLILNVLTRISGFICNSKQANRKNSREQDHESTDTRC